jgi:large subunit ribosomal protein L22
MQLSVKLNYLRISPRKVRLVADLIRGKRVEEASTILNFTVNKSSKPLLKLLNSALANARNNLKISTDNLYISKITVDEGPKYKRWMPRARGSAYEIQKKTSHVTLILDQVPGEKTKLKKKKTEESPKMSEKTEKQEEVREAKEGETTAIEKTKKAFRPRPERSRPRAQGNKGMRRFFQRKAV